MEIQTASFLLTIHDHLAGFIRFDSHRRAKQIRLKRARGNQHSIANHFGIQSLNRLAPVVSILAIHGGFQWISHRFLTPSSGCHDGAMELFQIPSATHELIREPIQQQRVSWNHTKLSKFGRGWNNRLSKMMQPNAIDEDPRDQGVFSARQRASISQPPSACRQTRVSFGQQWQLSLCRCNGQIGRQNFLLGLLVVSSMKQMRIGDSVREFRHYAQKLFLGFAGSCFFDLGIKCF